MTTTVRRSRRGIRLAVLSAAIAAMLTFVPVSASRADDTDDIVRQIDQKVAELGLTQSEPTPTIGKALLVRHAIADGDFTTASRIVSDVLAASRMQNWRFYPFDDFVGYVFTDPPPEFGSRLDEWVATDGGEAIPLLFRARYSEDVGYAARGDGFASTVPDADMQLFLGHSDDALADANAAVALTPDIPTGFASRLRILRGLGWSQQFRDAFEQGIAQHPDYYPLYELTLDTLQPRWGGSIELMTSFVDQFAGQSPRYSPLRLLYLSLYRHLLDTARVNCNPSGDNDDERVRGCVSDFMQRYISPDLQGNVADALTLYDHTEPYEFGLMLKSILFDMFLVSGGQGYAGSILQLAADTMHSDTSRRQPDPGRNNYVINYLVGEAWERQGFHDEAVARWLDAALAAQNTTFPSDEEKRLALADIYDTIATTIEPQKRYADQVVYESAATLLGVPWNADVICYGYFNLAAYQRAISACSDAIAATGNSRARYWRGSAYQLAGQPDAALSDLRMVAEKGGYFAPYAAVTMSLIYFDRGDNQAALDVLNAYPVLYDTSRTAKAEVAVAYNNRCYAHMELGHLQQALDDCNQSLRYGSLPEAIRKQKELMARLASPQ